MPNTNSLTPVQADNSTRLTRKRQKIDSYYFAEEPNTEHQTTRRQKLPHVKNRPSTSSDATYRVGSPLDNFTDHSDNFSRPQYLAGESENYNVWPPSSRLPETVRSFNVDDICNDDRVHDPRCAFESEDEETVDLIEGNATLYDPYYHRHQSTEYADAYSAESSPATPNEAQEDRTTHYAEHRRTQRPARRRRRRMVVEDYYQLEPQETEQEPYDDFAYAESGPTDADACEDGPRRLLEDGDDFEEGEEESTDILAKTGYRKKERRRVALHETNTRVVVPFDELGVENSSHSPHARNDVDTLLERIHDLESRLNQSEIESDRSSKLVRSLAESLDIAQAQVSSLSSEVTLCRAKTADREKEMERLVKLCRDQTLSLRELERENGELQTKVAELQNNPSTNPSFWHSRSSTGTRKKVNERNVGVTGNEKDDEVVVSEEEEAQEDEFEKRVWQEVRERAQHARNQLLRTAKEVGGHMQKMGESIGTVNDVCRLLGSIDRVFSADLREND